MNHGEIITHDHSKITQILEHMKALALEDNSEKLVNAILLVAPKAVRTMTNHFLLEESIIYPALIGGENHFEVMDDILAIQKEHGRIEQQIQVIIFLAKEFQSATTADEKEHFHRIITILIMQIHRITLDHLNHEEKAFSQAGIAL